MNKRRGLKLIRVNRFARECEIFVYYGKRVESSRDLELSCETRVCAIRALCASEGPGFPIPLPTNERTRPSCRRTPPIPESQF